MEHLRKFALQNADKIVLGKTGEIPGWIGKEFQARKASELNCADIPEGPTEPSRSGDTVLISAYDRSIKLKLKFGDIQEKSCRELNKRWK